MQSNEETGKDLYKTFDYLIDKYQMKNEERYIIYSQDLRYEDGILYIPFYMTICL